MKQWNKDLHIDANVHGKREKTFEFCKNHGEKIRPEWNLVDIWNNVFVLLVITVPKTENILFLLYFKSKIFIVFSNSVKLLEAVAL